MSPCPTAEQIEQFLLSESAPVEWLDLDSHLQDCPRCLQILEDLTRDSRIIRSDGSGAMAESPGPLLRRVLARPAGEEPLRSSLEAAEGVDTNGAGAEPSSSSRATGLSGVPRDEDVLDALEQLAPPERPGSLGRLGHYEILEVLGRGAFGVVFRAFDDVLQRVVAVKTLAVRLAATSPARKRFLREARAAGQVRHENVVQIYAVEERPVPYIVMEFLPGETLQQRLDRAGPFDAGEVVSIARQVADGLAAAHAAGLIHRDIKPGNILIEAGPRSRAKITDFGVARAIDDASLTQSGAVVGTPSYMSPEQARGEAVDHRSDLFSLGSVLYTITAGHPPFRANGAIAILKRVAEDTPRPIPEIIPEAPAWLCRLIAKLMAKDPADRFQTAAEASAALEAGPDSLALAPLKRRGRPSALVAGTAAAAGLLALAVSWKTSLLSDRSGGQAAETRPRLPETAAAPAGPEARPPVATMPTAAVDLDRQAAEWTLSVGGFVTALGDDTELRSPADLPRHPFILRRVDLGGIDVTDADLAHLDGLEFVEILSVASTPVTDAGLTHLRGLTNLKVLHAGGLRLTGKGFAHLKHLSRLVEIWANETEITDAGLAALEGRTGLIKLAVGGTKVTDAGMPHLKRCTGLTELWLNDTALTDAGLRQLKDLGSLTFLDVKHTAVTPKGLEDFHNARPNCRVEHDGGTIEPRL